MPQPALTDQQMLAAGAAVQQYGSVAAAARALNLPVSTLRHRYNSYKRRSAGNTPRPVPDGQVIRGVSTNYDADGNVVQTWVKTRAEDEDRLEQLRVALAALTENLPAEAPIAPPKAGLTDLANLYVITDYHIGMQAWPEETGDDWNIRIAEDLLVRWFGAAIEQAPDAEVGVLAQLGDFLHWDGLEAVTPASKHVLDADTRFQKLARVAIRVTRRVINLLLAKHARLHVLMAEGNHDPASSVWLREWLAEVYRDNPRVSVDLSPSPYYCYEHGKTSLFFHHGHKRPPKNIDHVFAARYREIYGRTEHSYAHLGHLHNETVLETNLMKIEQHPTLAGADAYAARGGWISRREASVITYSKAAGCIGRVVLTPEMVGVQ